MVFWFWTVLCYSFLGFLLELLYTRLTHQAKRDRKCLLFLPLCPVYGLGAAAILALPAPVAGSLPLLWLSGGLAATAVEYLLAAFYEETLSVKFWDYSAFPHNLDGRVCPPFALAWGGLAVVLRRWLHPALAPYLAALPAAALPVAVALLTADTAATLALLSHAGDTAVLRWYDRF